MTRPAIQLHSVRDLSESLPAVLHRVKTAGFEGVEFAGRLQTADPAAVADALDDTGLTPVGVHVDLTALESERQRQRELCEEISCSRVIVPHLPAIHFRTTPRVRNLAARFRHVAADLARHDIELLYHNTRYDLSPPLQRPGVEQIVTRGLVPGPIEGRVLEPLRRKQHSRAVAETGIGYLAEYTEPSMVQFELDTGEIVAADHDHDRVFDFFSDRLPLVHVCDVTGPERSYRSTSPGTGVLDFQRVFAAAEDNDVEWMVYEHDHPEDPGETIQRGAETVVSRARERQPTPVR